MIDSDRLTVEFFSDCKSDWETGRIQERGSLCDELNLIGDLLQWRLGLPQGARLCHDVNIQTYPNYVDYGFKKHQNISQSIYDSGVSGYELAGYLHSKQQPTV